MQLDSRVLVIHNVYLLMFCSKQQLHHVHEFVTEILHSVP